VDGAEVGGRVGSASGALLGPAMDIDSVGFSSVGVDFAGRAI
jgi:hypothetical protein